MVTIKVFYSSVLVMFVCLFNFSCKGAERNATTDKDTNILARSDQSFRIETGKSFYQTMVVSTGKKVTGDKKILLLLDAPVVGKNPDGVYEVYVCRGKCDINILSPSHPGFITVLDLYALTVNEPPNYLFADITKKAFEWVKDGQSFPSLTITILFRGNVLPGNIESKQAGEMVVTGMRVVQKKQ